MSEAQQGMKPVPVEELTGRVIVVDDSIETADVMVRHMRLEGFDARSLNDPVVALEQIKADPPDVVLLDVNMPRMNGMEVLERLRSYPPTTELPIIMVTANNEPVDIVRGLDLGANDYLTKPPQFEVLAARVRTQIKIKRLQDQRRKDIAELRELSAIKDKFLQIAAHDLRNPLNNIVLGIELLGRVYPDTERPIERFDEILGTMRSAANVMRSIANDFLDLQAIRTGSIQLNRKPVSLNEMARSIVAQYQAQADAKELVMRVILDESLPPVLVDEDRMVQVISNLVSNAIKFSPAGATVGVRTRAVNGQVMVEVVDTGPGIPPEEIPLLFQEFVRLSNKPTGGEKSSGVGLSIARQLVELHGGRIGVKSQVGKGSLFWFTLLVEGA
jgi:signal transduction histidine kinase